MNSIKKHLSKYIYVYLVALGFVILLLRGYYNLETPIIYAEDGDWISYMWQHGYLKTAFGVRGDYPVFWLATLLKISDILCNILFSGNISYLPYTIFFVSTFSYIFVAMLPYILLKDKLGKKACLLIYLLILLLPLGNTSNEILGRILQGHFFMWYVVFILLIYRYYNEKNLKKLLVTDCFIISCLLTNPVVAVGIAGYILFSFYKKIIKKDTFYNKKYQLIIFFTIGVLMLYLFIRMINYEAEPVDVIITSNNTIEFFAKSLLYPFIFGIYDNLNDCLSVILLCIMSVYYYFAYKKMKKETKTIFILSIVSTLAITLIMYFTRSFLRGCLLGYKTANVPDRYFLLMNICNIVTFSITLNAWNRSRLLKYFSILIILLVGVEYINNLEMIFPKENKCLAVSNVTFKERLKNSSYNTKNGNFVVEIDPSWKMEIPPHKMKTFMEDIYEN